MNSKKPRELFDGAGVARLRRRFLPAWALMAVSAAMLGGCQVLPQATADATRFFVLSGPAAADAAAAPQADGVRRRQLGLRAVELPAYLRTSKSMVVRDGGNEIRYQDYSRWAEPLDAGVNRVLRERLLQESWVAGVEVHPIRGDVVRDFDVSVRILRCEGVAGVGPVARFAASYEIVTLDGSGEVLKRGTFTAEDVVWDGKDFSALAKALSDGVSGLAARIAADLAE